MPSAESLVRSSDLAISENPEVLSHLAKVDEFFSLLDTVRPNDVNLVLPN
ncbi:MAG: hypothetical protein ABFR53_06320 [Actinomycetota bacterium]